MRQIVLLAACLLSACSAGLIYKPMPPDVLNPEDTARLTGSVSPWGLYFTAVTRYDGSSARVAVLSEIGLKLLDFSASQNGAAVYYKFDKLPDAAAGAFIRFARQNLLAPCPAKQITFTDGRTRARFEASVQGAKKCL